MRLSEFRNALTFVMRFDFPDDDCARVRIRVFLVEMDLGERGTIEVGHTVATELAAELKTRHKQLRHFLVNP